MKYFLILNPGSHGGKSGKQFRRLFLLLKKYHIVYDHEFTHTLEDAYHLSLNKNKKGDYYAIVAVGGDGTINAVINGFYDQSGRRISDKKFGVIYTGTSPDFCKSYQVPLKLDRAVECLGSGHFQEIPIGKISMMENNPTSTASEKNSQIVKYFACCANIGLGAAVARRANNGIRRLIGDFAGTFVALIITLVRFRANTFTIIADGNEEKIELMYNCSVGLTPYIASGIRVNQSNRAGSHSFYCLTAKGLKLRHAIPLFRKIYSGKPFANNHYLSLLWHRKLEFFENPINPEVEFDGDPAGYLPCNIELATDTLELIS